MSAIFSNSETSYFPQLDSSSKKVQQEKIADLWYKKIFPDLIFITPNGETIKCHKSILCSWSDLLSQVLQGYMNSSSQEKVKVRMVEENHLSLYLHIEGLSTDGSLLCRWQTTTHSEDIYSLFSSFPKFLEVLYTGNIENFDSIKSWVYILQTKDLYSFDSEARAGSSPMSSPSTNFDHETTNSLFTEPKKSYEVSKHTKKAMRGPGNFNGNLSPGRTKSFVPENSNPTTLQGSCHHCKNKKDIWLICSQTQTHKFCHGCARRHFGVSPSAYPDGVTNEWQGCPVCFENCGCAACRRKREDEKAGDSSSKKRKRIKEDRGTSTIMASNLNNFKPIVENKEKLSWEDDYIDQQEINMTPGLRGKKHVNYLRNSKGQFVSPAIVSSRGDKHKKKLKIGNNSDEFVGLTGAGTVWGQKPSKNTWA